MKKDNAKLALFLSLTLIVVIFLFSPQMTSAEIMMLFQEDFEDTNFASRGWYDETGGTLSSTEHISGSAKSFECRFDQGSAGCAGGVPGRHLFPETDSVYYDFWVKYSANYMGSGLGYGPHEFYFLTNMDGPYIGPAGTHLTTYMEQNAGNPRMGRDPLIY